MNIKRKVIKGVKWSLVGSVAVMILLLLRTIILSRILSPDEFGAMAMIIVFIGFALPLMEFGLSAAIIQEKNINHVQLSTLYWINILSGVSFFALMYLLAPLVANFYEKNNLTGYIKITSLVFLIKPFGSQFSALLTKNLAFDRLNQISIVGTILSLLLAVCLAVLGYGVYTLIYSYIFESLVSSMLFVFFGKRYHFPGLHFNINSSVSLLKFGLFQTGTSLVNYTSANIDKLLIGKFIGAYELGLYTIAWNLVLVPLRKINPIVNKVAFPVFSTIKEKIDLAADYYKQAVLVLLIINFPIFLFIMLNSSEVISLLYGEKWLAASNVLMVLAVVGLLKSFANPGGSLILSKGRADVGFYWNIGWTLGLVVAYSICLTIHCSIEMVAIAQLFAGVCLGPVWHWLVVVYGKVRYRNLLKEIAMLMLFFIPAWGAVWIVNNFLPGQLYLAMILKLFAGSTLYVLFLNCFFKKHLKILFKLLT